MIFGPMIGERVRVHYRPALGQAMPWQGCHGEIVAVATGRPKNVSVRMDGGPAVVFPCGNLVRMAKE